jgi:hypothetical protein
MIGGIIRWSKNMPKWSGLSSGHCGSGAVLTTGRAQPKDGRPLLQPLRAHLEYDADGALLFRLSGHEERRFARVLEAFRAAVPLSDREWVPQQEAWTLFGGWDDELLEILEDFLEPEEIFVSGRPLQTQE